MKLLDLYCGAGGAAMLDVLPSFSANNRRDGLSVEAKFTRKRMDRGSVSGLLTQTKDLRLVEFGCGVGRSDPAATRSPRFLSHVDKVSRLTSEFQMGRVHTGRVITAMHDAHSFGDRSVVNFPTNSVCPEVERGAAHLTVPARPTRCFPFPTGSVVSAFDVGPKLYLDRSSMRHIGSIPETPPCGEIFHAIA